VIEIITISKEPYEQAAVAFGPSSTFFQAKEAEMVQ
jgi:hypothetical protein